MSTYITYNLTVESVKVFITKGGPLWSSLPDNCLGTMIRIRKKCIDPRVIHS